MIRDSTADADTRSDRLERVVRDLLPLASQLTRLVLGQARARDDISRAEGGILRTLTVGPMRVTELAQSEGLAQPTTTMLVRQLEQRGWVARVRDADDRRAVLVSLTPEGAQALERYRTRYRALLRDRLEALPDEQIAALDGATEALEALVAAVRKGAGQ
ncbi:MAG TPA: MarR family transcriptional regulator [Solirubrobacteraceae bacterium]|jgi:DNA-binding MarR family transcriptional regulator|nr:MarR family transcriptional regulator [Solirubrobacteraceae bacterium]